MIRRKFRYAVALALAAAFSLIAPTAALAIGDPDNFGVEIFEAGTVQPDHRAGAHPSIFTKIRFKSTQEENRIWTDGIPRRIEVDLPMGLVGNPASLPKCRRMDFLATKCPPQSQLGIAFPRTRNVETGLESDYEERPIYNLVTDGNEPALLGIDVGVDLRKFTLLRTRVRPDGGLTTTADNLPSVTAVLENTLYLWGVPADENKCNPSHPEFDPAAPSPYDLDGADPCPTTDPADWPRRPFVSMPTNCAEVPTATLRALSYEGRTHRVTVEEHPIEDCDSMVFQPSIDLEPTSSRAGGVSGMKVEIEVPQNEDPEGQATPHIRDVEVTLPEGVALDPGAARSLVACTDAAFGKGQEGPAQCPSGSKVGRIEVETPLLDRVLPGDVYIGEPLPGDRYRLFLYIDDEQGVRIKIVGSLRPDPVTGQLTSVFRNNPQTPFERMRLEFRGGEDGVLAMPQSCGTKTTWASFTPWSGQPPVVVADSFQVSADGAGAPCPPVLPFSPRLRAGTASAAAGTFSPFSFELSRQGGERDIAGIELTMPRGMLAKLAGVPLCGEAMAATGSCPAASQVGVTTIAAGSAPSPLWVPQPGKAPTAVYLAGPYRGAPYSLVVRVPAQAGPYDLGVVTVRNAIHLDPASAQVTVKSDPLPQIIEGIPVTYREIRVRVDRPGFTLNPTNCAAKAIEARVASVDGGAALVSSPFQASGCAGLGFKPRLSLRLRGGTKRSQYPALTAVMRARPGDANIGRVSVALPRSEFLEQAHIRTICTRVQWAAEACPRAAVYGHAKAWTPLLDRPLEGPVYLRSSDNPLPDLVADLEGQVEIELAGRIDSVRGGIRTTFDLVPDAPVTRFVLRMRGGAKGLLVNSRNICTRTHRATVKMKGQNGKVREFRPQLKNSCKRKR